MAKGDHIFIVRRIGGIPFQHHGVDMGDGTVVHLAPASGPCVALKDDSGEFCVRRESYESFCRGESPRVVDHKNTRPVEDILSAATGCIGRTGYHLLDGNCEHFARMCVTGRAESHQIEMSEATVASLASLATKALWSVSSRASSRLAIRGGASIHPAAMLADGVEMVALAISCRSGLDAKRSRRLAKVSGTIAAAGIGTMVGGPAGAALLMATHASSSAIADQVCKTARKWLS